MTMLGKNRVGAREQLRLYDEQAHLGRSTSGTGHWAWTTTEPANAPLRPRSRDALEQWALTKTM